MLSDNKRCYDTTQHYIFIVNKLIANNKKQTIFTRNQLKEWS